ncbi:MAG TPA: VOC family protein [Gaiellaceae bacterium]|jgi:catechol 2,3-dioxygenase-like lactoylglutathione lyase family enzyme
MNVEHVDFVSVPVADLERSTAWYRNTLGLPQTGEGGFPEFKLGDNVFLYLIDPKSIGGGEFRNPHGSPIALRVADVAEARAELEARGIEFVGETYDTGVCHMAPFADPDGNRFMLHRRYAPND